MLALLGLMSWATLQSQAASPIPENQPPSTSSSFSYHLSELNPVTRVQQTESYGKLPLNFEVNQGQVDSQVKFLSRSNGYNLFLTSTEAVLTLTGT
jgi:hypothetical protein